MSIGHFFKALFFCVDNLWRFGFKWSENLAEGCSPNFPGSSKKALLPASPWGNEQHILQSHQMGGTEGKQKSGKHISYDTSMGSLLFFASGVVEDCGLLSSNALVVSILLEISKSGSLTFSVELRFLNFHFNHFLLVPQRLLF